MLILNKSENDWTVGMILKVKVIYLFYSLII